MSLIRGENPPGSGVQPGFGGASSHDGAASPQSGVDSAPGPLGESPGAARSGSGPLGESSGAASSDLEQVSLASPLADIVAAVNRSEVDARALSDEAMDRVRRARRRTGLSLQQLGFASDAVAIVRPPSPTGQASTSENSHCAPDEPSGARLSGSPQLAEPGSLAGIPIPIKDLHPIAGRMCSYGSAHLGQISDDNDSSVDELLRAGATIFGSSATSELGLSCYTEPTDLPAVVNPWLPGLTPGGSSGGAAALVARGIVPVAHGSDGGGSIRVPAACCGVVGFKPRMDAAGGSIRAEGFLTRSVEDAWFVHSSLHSRHGRGSLKSAQSLRPLRIGVLTSPIHADRHALDETIAGALFGSRPPSSRTPYPDPLIVGGVRIAADRLRAAGHEVVPVASPYPSERITLLHTVLSYRCASLEGELNELSSYFRDCGRSLSADDYARALTALDQLPAEVESVWANMAKVDVILSPTIAFPPPPVGTFARLSPEDNFRAQTAWTPWCTLWNLTGWAALSVPVVHTNVAGPWRGWPVSVHLGAVSDRVSELELLQAGEVVSPHGSVTAGGSVGSQAPGSTASSVSREGSVGTASPSNPAHSRSSSQEWG